MLAVRTGLLGGQPLYVYDQPAGASDRVRGLASIRIHAQISICNA